MHDGTTLLAVHVTHDDEGHTLPFETTDPERLTGAIVDAARGSGFAATVQEDNEITVSSDRYCVYEMCLVINDVAERVQKEISGENLDRIQARDTHFELG